MGKLWIGALLLAAALPRGTPAEAQSLKPDEINQAQFSDKASSRALTTKVQILLDRDRFSPGVIDGRMGENVKGALSAFQSRNDISGSQGELDDKTWSKLKENAPDKVIVEYKISESDVKGPFTKEIPDDFEKKKDLERLGYTNAAELLAEKFHMDEDFLKELNPGKEFSKAGTSIMVANVADASHDGQSSSLKRIEVDKAKKQVRAYGEDGKLIAMYPATVGSEERPAPSGTLEVKGVAENPTYTYDPKLNFKGVKADKPFEIAPGPNNPVGKIWIDLSKEGYGIHGTPDPADIGKTASHGCVRLTNWDAEALGHMVKPGIKVEFVGES